MGTQFAGPGNTYVALRKGLNGDIVLSVTNDGWSARDGERYEVSYNLNGKEYAEGTTIGFRSGAARGFWSRMGRDFARDFAQARDLSLFLDGTFIRKVSLTGSAAAIAALDRCVAGLRGRTAAERGSDSAEVPSDPFAKPARKERP